MPLQQITTFLHPHVPDPFQLIIIARLRFRGGNYLQPHSLSSSAKFVSVIRQRTLARNLNESRFCDIIAARNYTKAAICISQSGQSFLSAAVTQNRSCSSGHHYDNRDLYAVAIFIGWRKVNKLCNSRRNPAKIPSRWRQNVTK